MRQLHLVAGVACAVLATTPANATPRRFDVPPQPLSNALRDFAIQGRAQVLYSSEALKGKQSPGVRGLMEPDVALQRILDGTNLSLRRARGAFVVSASTPAPPARRLAAGPLAQAAPSETGVDEVVVTARKREESLQDVPVAVTVLSGDALRERSVQSVSDIQQQTPSLSLSPGLADRNSLIVTVRGQTNTDLLLTVDPAVGIYIDGVNLAKSITGELTSLTDIERVEVLKGPQGTLYGRNTTGGSINVFTRSPTFDPEGEVTLRAGRFNRYGGAIVFNLPILADQVALRVAGGYDRRDALGRNQVTGEGNGGDLNGGSIRATLLVRPAATAEFILRGDYTTSTTSATAWQPRGLLPGSAAAVAVGLRLGLGPQAATAAARAEAAAAYVASAEGGGRYDSNQDFLPSRSNAYSWGVSGALNWDLADNVALKSISAYRVADRVTFFDMDGSPFPILHSNGYTHQEIVSQELQLAGDAADRRVKWILGGYYSREFGFDGTQSVSLNALAARSFNEGHVVNKSIAGFGQVDVRITDHIGVTAGLRYTDEDKRLVSTNRRLDGLCNLPVSLRLPGRCVVIRDDSWDAWNYTLSADWKPADGVLLYARTSTGFRSGGHNLRGGVDPVTFQTFDPEDVTDYESGLKADWLEGRLRTNFAAYYTRYRNIQRTVLVPATLTPSATVVRNAARGRIYGVEAEATFVPVRNLTLGATFGLTDAKYDEYRNGMGADLSGLPFNFIPRTTYSLSAAYVAPLASGDLRLQADWAWRGLIYYVSEGLFDGANGLPDLRTQKGFGLLNARITKHFKAHDLSVAVYAKNILGQKYFATFLDTTSSPLGFNSGMLGEPATWGVELTRKFP